MSAYAAAGFPPPHITTFLRIEGLAVFAAAVAAFHLTGGNWWLFAALILAPDLTAIGYVAGPRAGATAYNLVHTYTVPIALGTLAWLAGGTWALPVALIWIAHIGIDRALGYGLKYDSFGVTHLGLIGRARRESLERAQSR
jgi:hypothetical protein